jgi:hypothetical protein
MRHPSILSLPGTATLTVPLFVAESDGEIISADYVAQGATDGTKTAQIKNNTQNFNITNALTISGVAALTKAPFVMASTNAPIRKGDVIVLIYTVTVAGAVGPGEAAVDCVFQEPVGQHFGPAWAG